MWQWWKEPILRMAKVPRISCLQTDGNVILDGSIVVEKILFQRRLFAMPPDVDKYGQIKTVFSAKGVPGVQMRDGHVFVPSWQCEECKSIFIVGDPHDLRHACTEPN